MSTINNSFFTDMFGTNQSSSSSVSYLFGNQSSALGDLALIRSGSYKKLLKSYYNTQKSDSDSSSTTVEKKNTSSGVKDLLKNQVKTTSKKTTTEVDSKVATAYSTLNTNALSLQDAAKKLRDTPSLYQEKKNADGDMAIDWDTLTTSVKSFVQSYNDTLDAAGNVSASAIQRNAQFMVSSTNSNKNALADMGITVDEDNKLVFDEDKFKSADIKKIQSTFTGSYSYMDTMVYRANYTANMASSSAYQSVSASSYTNTGTYSTTGTYNFYNTYF